MLSCLSPREVSSNSSLLENQINFPCWNVEFSLQSSVLKFTEWYQIQRKASQREGGGGSERGGRLNEPAGSQRGDGHLLRINCFTRGCAGDVRWLFALDRAGQEVSGLVVPRDPEWP